MKPAAVTTNSLDLVTYPWGGCLLRHTVKTFRWALLCSLQELEQKGMCGYLCIGNEQLCNKIHFKNWEKLRILLCQHDGALYIIILLFFKWRCTHVSLGLWNFTVPNDLFWFFCSNLQNILTETQNDNSQLKGSFTEESHPFSKVMLSHWRLLIARGSRALFSASVIWFFPWKNSFHFSDLQKTLLKLKLVQAEEYLALSWSHP